MTNSDEQVAGLAKIFTFGEREISLSPLAAGDALKAQARIGAIVRKREKDEYKKERELLAEDLDIAGLDPVQKFEKLRAFSATWKDELDDDIERWADDDADEQLRAKAAMRVILALTEEKYESEFWAYILWLSARRTDGAITLAETKGWLEKHQDQVLGQDVRNYIYPQAVLCKGDERAEEAGLGVAGEPDGEPDPGKKKSRVKSSSDSETPSTSDGPGNNTG